MRQRLASILGHSLAALFAVAPLANAQAPSVTGTWVNDHGSVLVIQSIGANGSVTGTYANNATGYKCAGVAFPLVGWATLAEPSDVRKAATKFLRDCIYLSPSSG
jgi:hypothetical protein